jgi:hypothetical protein
MLTMKLYMLLTNNRHLSEPLYEILEKQGPERLHEVLKDYKRE